jgi:hypothetical protein
VIGILGNTLEHPEERNPTSTQIFKKWFGKFLKNFTASRDTTREVTSGSTR